MKQLILILASVLSLTLAACGNDTSASSDNNISSQTQNGSSQTESTGPVMITGTLYSVFGKNEVRESNFGYEKGTCTPEKIAAAFSALTGLNFNITSQLNSNNTVIIDWKADSAIATGQPPENQIEDYHFFDAETLRLFMLNSLCRTIRENMESLDVFYTLGGDFDNMNNLDLNLEFSPGIAYNKIEDSRVLG